MLADNPVAYYRFAEPSGTVAVDTSGNGNPGAYIDVQLNQWSAPNLGRSGRFDGLGSFVSTDRTVSTGFTLEMWVRTTSSSPGGSAAYEGDGLLWSDVGGGANDFVMGYLNNSLSFFTGDANVSVNATQPLNDGRWHHLVSTRRLGSGVEDYIDGVLVVTGATGSAALDSRIAVAQRDR